ncbi:hypothetical protein ARMGADRAFT_1015502 [Armillaria gallica]|uniref:Uncharacterized protein n=1 Tax=Armillaria gallica TaxID=47427 RepID=A0A2H3D245_ARMGA|nr:hypothetical protein ARMGADRAFT_1015502 [Armillaria gallica]
MASDEYEKESGRTRTQMEGKTRNQGWLGKLPAFELQDRESKSELGVFPQGLSSTSVP